MSEQRSYYNPVQRGFFPDPSVIWVGHAITIYIFVTLRVNGDGTRGINVLRRQLVMVSDRPEGTYSKPVCLEVDSIDPSHFVDEDGKRYMITAKAAQAAICDREGK